MTGRDDPLSALRRVERHRLDRFAEAFDEIDPLRYENFGVQRADEAEFEAARQSAMAAIGPTELRRAAAKAAVKLFVDKADRRIAERHEYAGLLLGSRIAPSRAHDRATVLRSLESAVVAVMVWDELTVDERAILLGPWGQVADAALEDAGLR